MNASLSDALAGRYILERELGQGGMATVYLARDVKHDREVAIKVLKPDLSQTLGAERFLREIQLVARLSHPHILPLFDSGDAGGVLFYVMPRVAGASLRDRLDDAKQLPVHEAVRIASEVAGALDYAHRHGVVHRDIKPENIMLQDGHALVADFGIGKALSAVEGDAFTQVGMSVGTPAYMSPEQAVGETVDGRSDLYSLGCVLYEMLIGEPPFTGPSVQAVIAKRFVQTPADVMALRDGIRRPVARALQKALARTPIDRYDTAAEFVTAMEEADAAPVAARSAIPERSIAVLPFTNMSTDPENEYFADGITDELLTALSQIGDLTVAGRSSSFSFKGHKLELREVAEQLKVRTVLEGQVRRSGKRVRVTAQLTDAGDGYQLWSEKYDREIEDVFALQDEIAAAIAGKLKTTLTLGTAARAQRVTHSIEAYEWYLKGRAMLARRGKALLEGVACMERALALDPEYGLAWAGIAEAHVILGYYGLISPELARARAVPAAEKAVQFAPDVGDAHCALGITLLMCDYEDRPRAAQAFERGISLSPTAQGATWYYYFYLAGACGRLDDGLAAMRRLIAQDELSPYLHGMFAILLTTRRDAHAPESAMRAIGLEPDAFLSHFAHQAAAAAVNDWPRSVAAGEALFALGGRTPNPLAWYAKALNRSGNLAGARAVQAELVTLTNDGERAPWALACVAAELGDTDKAVAYARDAMRRRDPMAMAIMRQPPEQSLRALDVWPEIEAAMRLPASDARAST
jgi:serine/threonine protein kinase/tetratricopeptide (TPR) repeat protein